MLCRFAALAACLVLITGSVDAQETTGAIEGAVPDQTSSALAGARIA